jgi:hypothetical protein
MIRPPTLFHILSEKTETRSFDRQSGSWSSKQSAQGISSQRRSILRNLSQAALIALAASFLSAGMAEAQGTYTAASANESDVNAVIHGPIHTAVNGDVIQIPCSGTQSVVWTSQLTVSASITLTALGATPNTTPSTYGSGTNCLTIRDNVPYATGTMMVFTPTYSATNNVTTIQNIDIDPYSTSTALWNPISIEGTGTSSGMPEARVDNIVFGNAIQWNFSGNTVASTQLIKPDNVVGVADHNTLPSGNGNELMTCNMSSLYGVGQFGDNSWAQPDSFGGSLAWFNENNLVHAGQTFQDCTEAGNSFTESGGGRLVNRFNVIYGTPFQIASGHGTESTGRPRAYRHIEAYNNTLNCTGNCQDFVSARGGTIYSHNNLANISSGGFMDQLFDITIFRRVFSSIPWGACGGLSTASGGSLSNSFPGDPWDTVDNTAYYTGNLSGVASLTLTVSGASWTTNQWSPAGAGYTFYDTTQGFASEILSNTANTLTINQNAGIGNSWSAPNPGDAFKIIRATVCQDQAGRGQGNYISGESPTPATPLNQALDPVREWNDVVPPSDVVQQYASQFGGNILANRDYYTDNWKTGGLSGPTAQTSTAVPFNGSTTCNAGSGNYSCGMGEGTLANRPTTCTTGVGYWATDQGSWNQSGLACSSNGAGTGQGCQGELFTCTSANTWTPAYTPYTYPHPLVSGTSSTATAPPPPSNLNGTLVQ